MAALLPLCQAGDSLGASSHLDLWGGCARNRATVPEARSLREPQWQPHFLEWCEYNMLSVRLNESSNSKTIDRSHYDSTPVVICQLHQKNWRGPAGSVPSLGVAWRLVCADKIALVLVL